MLTSTVTPDSAPTTTTRPPQPTGVALVTGGGRGIGRTLARSLAGEGKAVALVARSGDELDETVELVRRDGGTAAAARADVTDAAGLAGAVAGLQDRLGPVDLLVNNAGVIGPIGPLWEDDPDAWWAAMDVNLRGVVLTSQLVLPGMVARRRGRIINVTSRAGTYRWPLVSAYSVSKAAVVKLTENLAHEVRRHGISVFSVHPGLLPIGMTETVAGTAPSTHYEDHVRRWAITELKDAGAEPAEAMALLMRLAAGDADALTGRHLSVHDDLDALLARVPEVLRDDLYVLRPERLRQGHQRATATARRSGSRPAYLRGLRARDWQSAFTRSRRRPPSRATR